MKIKAIIKKSCLQGEQPKELEIKDADVTDEELRLQDIDLDKAREFLSSFSLKCRSSIYMSREGSVVYSIEIPMKFFEDLHFFDRN